MSDTSAPPPAKSHFWDTLSGLIAGIAAFITAIAGVVALYIGTSDHGESDEKPKIASTSTPAAPIPQTPDVAGDTSPPITPSATSLSATNGILWQKEVVLDGKGVNIMDEGPVRATSSEGELHTVGSIYLISLESSDAQILQWKPFSPNSRAKCQALISSYGTDDTNGITNPEVGSTFCIRSKGRYSSLTLIRKNEFDDSSWVVRITAWK
jgi:hypothetical protein